VRDGNEQDGIKTAQSFEIPGRDLKKDAALFFGYAHLHACEVTLQ
jgi:hypothetical protein